MPILSCELKARALKAISENNGPKVATEDEIACMAVILCDEIQVMLPPFKSRIASQNREHAEIKRYVIAEESNMPEGFISRADLVANYRLWESRGYCMSMK